MTIARPKVARGAKVLREHLTGSVGAVAASLSSAAVAGRDLQEPLGVFRVNLHVPWVGPTMFVGGADGRARFAIPFCLPPFQEFWHDDGVARPGDPRVILDEMTVSFDQRGEAAAILTNGRMSFVEVNRLGLRISLLSKQQQFFDANSPVFPSTELASLDLPAEAFSGPFLRLNPAVVSGIDRLVDPSMSLMVVLDAPDITGLTPLILPSMCISLRFRCDLTARDSETLHHGIQNMPSPWLGDRVTKATGQTAIAGNAAITEANLHGNVEQVDQTFRRRIEGGTLRESLPPAWDEIADDACYDVIAVPMWSNTSSIGTVAVEADHFPYYTAPGPGATCDRRIVSLHYPLTVHHVVAAACYQNMGLLGNGTLPTLGTFHNHVGVAVWAGKEGDHFGYQQVAEADWTPATKSAYAIDYLKHRPDTLTTADTHDLELLSVPLVGAGGSGYVAQGLPIMAGRTKFAGATRTQVGGGVSAADGAETHLEVRWELRDDAAGLASVALGGVVANTVVYAGTGGHWVFIIGKKMACADFDDVPL